MKFRYTGPDEKITLRQTTFKKGEAVDVACEDLQAKIAALDYFKEVKQRAKRNDKNKD